MRVFFIILFFSIHSFAQENSIPNDGVSPDEFDIIITNGRILDGTGNSWYRADIGISRGKIIRIGSMEDQHAKKIIDANNQLVAPGFIDVHTHIEQDEVRNPTADNFIYDGVTTVITGNCGESKVDLENYFATLDSLHTSINIASLIGHNDIRKSVMGSANRFATEEELQKMEHLVEQAMKDGAVGFSTGLIYVPGTYAPTPEIIRLARIAAKYRGVYATHMRSESDEVTAAIEEALLVGREANIPVQISHFKVGGQPRPGRSHATLSMIENARRSGIEVTIDQYPYTASSTSLNSLLPSEILEGGRDSTIARLLDKTVEKDVIERMVKRLKQRGKKHYDYAVVTNYKFDSTLNGKSIEEINKIRGNKRKAKQEARTILEMVKNGGAGMVFHGMWEEDVKNIMQYPFNMIASDASIRIFGEGVPHPRGYGSNGRVLSKYVRDEKIITLEEAVRRMTSLPARKFNLKQRGLILEGHFADIIIFDENTISDQSTYSNPHAYTKGISTVIVNGQIVVDKGKHLGTRSGIVIRNLESGPGD